MKTVVIEVVKVVIKALYWVLVGPKKCVKGGDCCEKAQVSKENQQKDVHDLGAEN